jgi:hypothetical protein
MSRRKNPEQQIQIAVFQHIKVRGIAGAKFWHTPNGGSRNIREAAKLKQMGVLAGVSDVLAFHNSKLYAMEIKAPGGRATKEQLDFVGDLDRQGAFTAIPEGLDAALATLEAWGLIRPAIKNIADVARRAEQREAAE